MFWINFLNIKISHKNCSKTGPSFTGCLPLTAAFNIDITAVYLGAAIRRENSRYFSILYRHHNLAKLNSESKTQGGYGGSWTYKVSIKWDAYLTFSDATFQIKMRRLSYISDATFESSSSISIKWDAYLTFLTPLSIKWDAYVTFLTFIIFDNYAISAITFGKIPCFSCTRSCLLRLWIFFWKTHLQINVLVP